MIAVERWRDVPGYEGRYQVSDRGKVRTRRGRVLKPYCWGCPHLYVALYAGNRRQYRAVAHLVLESFDRPARAGEQARHHPDPTPTNNAIINLRWGSHADNMRDRDRHGNTPRGSRSGQAKLTEADVVTIRQAHASGTPVREIADEHNVHPATIRAVLSGTTWRHVA